MTEEENLHIDESSLIFKPIVLAIFFIGLLVAIWFQLYMVIGILSFILILGAFIYVWNKLAIKHIDVTMDLPISRVFNGDTFEVKVTVKNDQWIPLVWLDVKLNDSPLVMWDEQKYYIVRFMWLLAYQHVDWTVKGRAQHRGVYPVGELTVKTGDGFRFMESEKPYDMNQNIYIYPTLVSVQVPPFQPHMQWDVQGNQGGLLEDPLMVSGVREYELGDDIKRLNWWASARTGEMQTNVYERIVAKQLFIFVDVQGFVIHEKFLGEEEQATYAEQMKTSFERFLSVIASFVVAYDEQGIHVGLQTNALNAMGHVLPTVRPQKDMTHVLDSLAQMTQLASSAKLLPTDQRQTMLYVFCHSMTDDHLQLINEKRGNVHVYYAMKNDVSDNVMNHAQPISDLQTGGVAT